MKLVFVFIYVFLFYGIYPATAQSQPNLVREKLSLDKGWLFHLGDIPFPNISGHDQSYRTSKAGSATGAASTQYDDSKWRKLNLPHDWAVEQPFDSTENLSQGFRKRGYGWYRRYFKLNPEDKGKNIELQFDGIATNSVIWVNGTVVHRNFCGYTSSYLDITPLAKYDGVNVIAIQVDAKSHEGWWYEGAGIYRHTWLVKRPALHIITDGIYANPIKSKNGTWQIPVEATLANSGSNVQDANIEVNVFDKHNKHIASAKVSHAVLPLQQAIAKLSLSVQNPQLWSVEAPNQYRITTTITSKNQIVDELSVKCGFRTIEFRADSGFFLNNKHVKLKGTCNHQDHAGVGVAVPDALWEFRLSKLKEMGSNAYRCSHSPVAAEFLDACDSLGILVMDENRNFNTSDEYVRQLEWMVRRDRNHPSVILWSVFNEEPFQGDSRGYEMVRYMSAKVKNLDTTRKITAAQSGGQLTNLNVSHAADVVGFNYQIKNYDAYHLKNPTKPMTSSEDVSAVMVRGEYVTNRKKNILADYDEHNQPWGSTNRVGWKAVAERPFLAGCFVWTGFDYRGEPQPNVWPSVNSVFGIMDLCGFPKSAYWIHQAQWRDDIPVLQMIPHWNWPQDSIGKKVKVMVMSNQDSVALFLNGKKLGGQKVDRYEMNTWQVPYQPGKLVVIGYNRNGKAVKHFKVETTGAPFALKLIPYRSSLKNDGWDSMPVTVQVVDRNGRIVQTANDHVRFELNENASIIGLGNGDPNSHEPEKGNVHSVFNGLGQLIIQAKEKAKGYILISAKSKNLKSTTVKISLKDVPLPPFL